MLKILILILLAAMIFSLAGGAAYFFKDQGETKRTMYMLGLRVTLAVLLILTLVYGVASGELNISAPWYRP